MGKGLGLICALTLLAVAAQAQDRPQALQLGHAIELSGGYAYTRLHLGTAGTSMNGGYGAIAVNLTPWMQFSADASVEYGQLGVSHLRIYGNHFGPRFFFRRPNQFHATPFAEVLAGGSRLDATVSGPGGFTFSDNGFSLKAGGGVDFDLSPRILVRAINADYYMTPFLGAHQNNLWLSTGIVFRFGAGQPRFK
jgi:opacity protein-like surface antigen